ncbi:hypothetical protein HMPREF9575_01837 [Cutibacterium acnes HL110PA1]|nr:hypothetical protein HMPREF9575_01837 [Cutibacterium acnes HL110PA1]EGF00820.1 hypothetical protein HMPREF9586_02132 [Cutibacterium acnes HL083PA2]
MRQRKQSSIRTYLRALSRRSGLALSISCGKALLGNVSSDTREM